MIEAFTESLGVIMQTVGTVCVIYLIFKMLFKFENGIEVKGS